MARAWRVECARALGQLGCAESGLAAVLAAASAARLLLVCWGSKFKDEFAAYCVENKIDMKKSCPYRAWQNGLIERCNRSISNLARTLMIQAGLPAEFWAHAVCTAAYTINRLSHKRLPGGITPYEAMHAVRSNIANMRVFGCHAELLIEEQYRKKDLTDPQIGRAHV